MEKLTQEYLKTLFDYNLLTGKLTWKIKKQGVPLSKKVGTDHNGYTVVRINGSYYKTHRLIWAWYYGDFPEDQIDHINGNRKDNSIKNLRDVSMAENSKNCKRRKDNKSGIVGVMWSRFKKKWRASIGYNGKTIRLGYFTLKKDAIIARKLAEKKYGYHPNHGRG